MDNLEKFYKACSGGDVGAVEKLIHKVDPSSGDNYALRYCACNNGHLDIVKILMRDPRVDPSALQDIGIGWAIEKDFDDIFYYLIEDKRVNKNNIFVYASEYNRLDILNYLFDRYPIDIPECGSSALDVCMSSDKTASILKRLLELGCNPNYDDNSLLLTACSVGNLEAVQVILDYSEIDPSHPDNKPLTISANNGYYDIVVRLLKDSRVDPSYNNQEALNKACKMGHTNIAMHFLDDDRIDVSMSNYLAIYNSFICESKNHDLFIQMLKHERTDVMDILNVSGIYQGVQFSEAVNDVLFNIRQENIDYIFKQI